MESHSRVFNAKVMLYGEYSLMVGSMALTIPFRKFSGSFRFLPENWSDDMPGHFLADNDASNTNTPGHSTPLQDFSAFDITGIQASRASLNNYLDYLMNQPPGVLSLEDKVTGKESTASFINILDLQAFQEDLANGMYFQSDIPGGAGLGSSGAVVAAVYDRYAYNKIQLVTETDFKLLKSILAAMESWFHGTSSGIDPLSCFLGTGLLMGSGQRKPFVTVTAFPTLTGSFFLIDTGVVGKTGPLVRAFLEKMESPGFRHFMNQHYIPSNDGCISAIIGGDEGSLEENMLLLSDFQMHHFKEMIPGAFFDRWKYGLVSGAYSLKLCGSGGGGFLLGYTRNPAVLDQSFPGYACLHLHLAR